mgnify:CR=1 FL=1
MSSPRLGLYALEESLSKKSAAAQGQHPTDLLITNLVGTVTVVQDYMEPVHPILGQLLAEKWPIFLIFNLGFIALLLKFGVGGAFLKISLTASRSRIKMVTKLSSLGNML